MTGEKPEGFVDHALSVAVSGRRTGFDQGVLGLASPVGAGVGAGVGAAAGF